MGFLEAMSFGTPGIHFEGRIDEDILIDKKTGFIVKNKIPNSKDIKNIATRILDISKNYNHYEEMVNNVREVIKKADIDFWVPKLLEPYI